jgi:nucleoside 2-deoxyribosyltransferase
MNCLRADNIETNTNKINEIIRNIWKSRLIIADITGLNSNVMYEIGFAHAMNKEVIMIYEEENSILETKFPFDIGHIDILKYKNNSVGGVELHKGLISRIDFVMNKIKKLAKADVKKTINDRQNKDLELSLLSHFEIRKNRIDYFTYHTIKNLIQFKNQHEKLLNMITTSHGNITEENYIKINIKELQLKVLFIVLARNLLYQSALLISFHILYLPVAANHHWKHKHGIYLQFVFCLCQYFYQM